MRAERSFVAQSLVLVVVVVLALPGTTASAGELIVNGGLESPFVNGAADGWIANRWGANAATYAPGPAHSGQSSQQIACQSFTNGGAAILCPLSGPIVSGTRYTVSLWMKAKGPVGMVRVALRRAKARTQPSSPSGFNLMKAGGDTPSRASAAGRRIRWN